MKRDGVPTIVVTVNNHLWNAVSSLRDAGPNDAVYTLNPENGSIAFGDGVTGAKPPAGSTVSVNYRCGSGTAGNISKRTNDAGGLTKFWVIVRDGEQAVGWGCSKK